jgi:hypothetical protein
MTRDDQNKLKRTLDLNLFSIRMEIIRERAAVRQLAANSERRGSEPIPARGLRTHFF